MSSEFILNLTNVSIEVIIISVMVFALTMLIKWPIKKATAKLEENKRKAVNTIIVFIPMILSALLNVLYSGLFIGDWLSYAILETTCSSYILAIAIYAVYSRIVILIKGAKSSSTNEDFSKETLKYLKQNIKTLSKTLKIDEKNLSDIITQINRLLVIKNEISSNVLIQDISQTEQLEINLNELNKQKQELTNLVESTKTQLNHYQMAIKKGD